MKSFKPLAMLATGILACIVIFSVVALAQQKLKLSDAEVASVAVAANQVDINYADIAEQRSSDAEILKFAQTMKKDHNAVIGQAAALVKKLGVTPKENSVSKKLLSEAEKTKSSLLKKTGKAFDKAYIDNEVAYHKAVIATIEGILIPETENQELKSLLQNVVPALKAHLGHAEMVQRNLNK